MIFFIKFVCRVFRSSKSLSFDKMNTSLSVVSQNHFSSMSIWLHMFWYLVRSSGSFISSACCTQAIFCLSPRVGLIRFLWWTKNSEGKQCCLQHIKLHRKLRVSLFVWQLLNSFVHYLNVPFLWSSISHLFFTDSTIGPRGFSSVPKATHRFAPHAK